jgi:hypothetical protein
VSLFTGTAGPYQQGPQTLAQGGLAAKNPKQAPIRGGGATRGPKNRQPEEPTGRTYNMSHFPSIIWAYPRHHFRHILGIIWAYSRHHLGIFHASFGHIPGTICAYSRHHVGIFQSSFGHTSFDCSMFLVFASGWCLCLNVVVYFRFCLHCTHTSNPRTRNINYKTRRGSRTSPTATQCTMASNKKTSSSFGSQIN